jgi:hypothetical protein
VISPGREPISVSALHAAAAGINGAFGKKPTVVVPGGYGATADEIRDAAVTLLREYGHAGTMAVEVVGGYVNFTPSESYMRGPDPQSLEG